MSLGIGVLNFLGFDAKCCTTILGFVGRMWWPASLWRLGHRGVLNESNVMSCVAGLAQDELADPRLLPSFHGLVIALLEALLRTSCWLHLAVVINETYIYSSIVYIDHLIY